MTKNGEKRYIFDLTNTKIDQSTMLSELRTFIAVSQYGTFSGAGARIGLTQSAVSAQMQRLEEELASRCSTAPAAPPRSTTPAAKRWRSPKK